MAKRFKKGDTAYVPVKIAEVEHEDKWYDYVVKTPAYDGVKAEFPFCVADEEIKTAEEVAGPLKTKADAMTVTADSLQKENEELKAKVAELTAWYHEANKTASEAAEANDELKARNAELDALLKEVTATRDEAIRQNNALVEENDKLGTERDQRNKDIRAMKKERDELEDANRSLTKACSEWQTAAQAHFKTTEKLREENKKLKQQLDDAEATYNVVADTSLERKNRVTTMEEVIVALVEKIRRLEGDD